MAKIRVEQIKNLSLGDSTKTGFATLEVGTTTKDVLTSIAKGTSTTTGDIMTGIAISGNTITPEYKSLAELNIYTKNEVNTAITTAIEALDTTADVTIASVANDVITLKAGIAQVDGKIQQGTGADITLAKVAKTGAAADVTIADATGLYEATSVEAALAEVMAKVNSINVGVTKVTGADAIVATPETGEVAVSLKIDDSDKVLTQSEAGLKANLGLVYDSTNKLIQLTGKTGEGATPAVIASIPANDFIKDGMLSSAKIVKGKWSEDGHQFTESTEGKDSAIRLEWNTDADKEVMYINSETLVDAYEAGNDGIVIDQNNNKISHKAGAENLPTESRGSVGNVVEGEVYTFNVPTVKVDGYGHVIALTEKSVTINVASTITDETSKKVATEGAVKTYVDNQVGAVKVPVHFTENIIANTDKQTTLTLAKTPYQNQAVVYQNGLCVIGEYEVVGTTIKLTLEVPAQVGDVFTVDYEI